MIRGLKFTHRGYLVIIISLTLLFYSYITLRYEVIAYTTFVMALFMLDIMYLAWSNRECIIVGSRRRYLSKVLLDSCSEVELEFKVVNGKGILVIEDQVSKELRVVEGKCSTVVNVYRNIVIKMRYVIKPLYRGEFYLGPLNIYFNSIFGLARYIPSVRVKNNLVSIKVVPSFYVVSIKPLTITHKITAPHGGHPIRSKGLGVELEYLREYMPGDDYRKIAWKPTARNPRRIPYVKETKTEIMLESLIVIDPSVPSSLGYRKRIVDYYVEAAGAIMLTAYRLGDPIGLYIAGIPSRLTIPSRRKEMLALGLEALEVLTPQLQPSRITSIVDVAKRVLPHRTIILMFTTLEGISEEEVEYIVNSLNVLKHIPVFIIPYTPSFTPIPKEKLLKNLYDELIMKEHERIISYSRLLRTRGALVSILPKDYFVEGSLNIYYSLREMG